MGNFMPLRILCIIYAKKLSKIYEILTRDVKILKIYIKQHIMPHFLGLDCNRCANESFLKI